MPRRGPFLPLLLDLLDVSLFRGFTLLSFGCGVPARFLGLEALRGFRSLDRPRKFLAPLQFVKKTSFWLGKDVLYWDVLVFHCFEETLFKDVTDGLCQILFFTRGNLVRAVRVIV